MPKYKMILTYDGTSFGGWQIQPNAISIQYLLEKALFTLLKKQTPVIGAGRTDAGVHALGQVAHFEAEPNLNLYRLKHSLNGLLPREIRITSLVETSEDFHARYSATGKIYHYHLHLDKVLNPFKRLYSWQVPSKVDPFPLEKAASLLIGTHDFTAFANEAHKGAAAKNAVRTLSRLTITPQEGGLCLEFEGDGFLYKMVRNITGTLVEVGSGLIAAEQIPDILASKDRKKAGHTAPPHGLFLVKVHYDNKAVKDENKEEPSKSL